MEGGVDIGVGYNTEMVYLSSVHSQSSIHVFTNEQRATINVGFKRWRVNGAVT